MNHNQLAEEWLVVGQRLGIRVAARCVVPLPDGARVEVDVWLPDFGSPAGMLLFNSDRWWIRGSVRQAKLASSSQMQGADHVKSRQRM